MHVLLMTRGFGVRTFASARAFLAEHAVPDCQCLLIDMHMPEMTGLALLQTLRMRGIKAPAIIITGGGDAALASQVQRAGAVGLLRKPVAEIELFTWVDQALGDGASPGCSATP